MYYNISLGIGGMYYWMNSLGTLEMSLSGLRTRNERSILKSTTSTFDSAKSVMDLAFHCGKKKNSRKNSTTNLSTLGSATFSLVDFLHYIIVYFV